LIACKHLAELATAVERLARRLLETRDVVVLLHGPDGALTAGEPSAQALEAWAAQLLEAGPQAAGLARSGANVAGWIDTADGEVQGVVAASLAESGSVDERPQLLEALAHLAATCCAQILGRARADRALQDTRALMARGLHDLCTPLNSLRLGMHLLEPALTTKDPAVAQRAHRAVDRMAALVTTLADALGKPEGGAEVVAGPTARGIEA
jgi:signal transduction histidine kinase